MRGLVVTVLIGEAEAREVLEALEDEAWNLRGAAGRHDLTEVMTDEDLLLLEGYEAVSAGLRGALEDSRG